MSVGKLSIFTDKARVFTLRGKCNALEEFWNQLSVQQEENHSQPRAELHPKHNQLGGTCSDGDMKRVMSPRGKNRCKTKCITFTQMSTL